MYAMYALLIIATISLILSVIAGLYGDKPLAVGLFAFTMALIITLSVWRSSQNPDPSTTRIETSPSVSAQASSR